MKYLGAVLFFVPLRDNIGWLARDEKNELPSAHCSQFSGTSPDMNSVRCTFHITCPLSTNQQCCLTLPYRRTIRSKLQEEPAELACWFPMLSFKRKLTDPIISAHALLSPFNYLWRPGLRCHRTATAESGKRDLLCVGTRVGVRVRAHVAMTRCHFGQKRNSPSLIRLDILPLSSAFGS